MSFRRGKERFAGWRWLEDPSFNEIALLRDFQMDSTSASQDSSPTKELMDAIFVDKVRRARQTPMDQKMLDGPRLFDVNCQIMRSGIRAQFPEFDEAQVEKEFERRLAIARRIDDAGIYRNVGTADE